MGVKDQSKTDSYLFRVPMKGRRLFIDFKSESTPEAKKFHKKSCFGWGFHF